VKVVTLYRPQLKLLQKTCADISERRPNVEFVKGQRLHILCCPQSGLTEDELDLPAIQGGSTWRSHVQSSR